MTKPFTSHATWAYVAGEAGARPSLNESTSGVETMVGDGVTATWNHATGTGTILTEKADRDGTTKEPGWIVIRGMPKHLSSLWTDEHHGGTAERPIKQGIGKNGDLVDIKDVVDFESLKAAEAALRVALKRHPIMGNIIRRDKTVPFIVWRGLDAD